METPSTYDSSYMIYFEQIQRTKRREEFIDKEMRKMTAFGDFVSSYDLGDVAKIRGIEKEAERIFGNPNL